eukprot:gene2949-2223_t
MAQTPVYAVAKGKVCGIFVQCEWGEVRKLVLGVQNAVYKAFKGPDKLQKAGEYMEGKGHQGHIEVYDATQLQVVLAAAANQGNGGPNGQPNGANAVPNGAGNAPLPAQAA